MDDPSGEVPRPRVVMSDVVGRLRGIAGQATPGPWWNSDARDAFGDSEHFVANEPEGRQVCSYFSDPDNVDDAVHIATFDPVLVVAMLDVIDAAEQVNELHVRDALARFREVAS